MQAALLPVFIAIISLVSLTVGIRGMTIGRRVGQTKGRDTLMHYPVPLPWLKKRVTAARWVVWMGQLYLSAGIAGLLGAGLIWTAPSQKSQDKQCEQIALHIQASFVTDLQGGRVATSPNAEGCTSTLLDHTQVRWFTIQSSQTSQRAGSLFTEEKQAFERSSYKITAVEKLGTRAAMATPRKGPNANSFLFFTDERGHHRIEMNALRVREQEQQLLVGALRSMPTSPNR